MSNGSPQAFPNAEDARIMFTTRGKPGKQSPVPIFRGRGETAFYFNTKMDIDLDGAPDVYHPPTVREASGCPPALDYLGNASNPANRPVPGPGQPWIQDNWPGIVVQNRFPCIQGPQDPAPGFYVSSTALQDRTYPPCDPRCYVDATAVPYIALPPPAYRAGGARVGDFAAVYNRLSGKLSFAIFADVGPSRLIGEGSHALALALGIPGGRHGGQTHGITYVSFPGSGNRRPRSISDINANGDRLFGAWGGRLRIADLQLNELLDVVHGARRWQRLETILRSVQVALREARDIPSPRSQVQSPQIHIIEGLDDACVDLVDFIEQVQKLSAAAISPAQRRSLTAEANQIRTTISC